MDYTVTIREPANIETLDKWAEAEFRDPADQLNAVIRQLLQQRGKTSAGTGQPRAVRQRRAQAA